MKTSKELQKCNSKVKKEDAKAVKIAETQSGADGLHFTFAIFLLHFCFSTAAARRWKQNFTECQWNELEWTGNEPQWSGDELPWTENEPK